MANRTHNKGLRRRLTGIVHKLDYAVGRLAGGPLRVLIELRTPVYHAILGPLADALERDPRLDVRYTSEYPDRILSLIPRERFMTPAEVEWTRFALYLNADPWAAARLRRCERRVNFFHGVAGKYDLDQPSGLPMGFEYYDRVAFINRDRMSRYLSAGIATPEQAVLVGYPKLDRLANRAIDGSRIREQLQLDPARSTVFYGPTYSPASSLHVAGEAIVRELVAGGYNVIVKLHDRSLDPDPRYSDGIDWRTRMQALEIPGRMVYVEGPDASPYLAAADVMLTDHSSVGFEYLVLDRPLLVFDTPGLTAAARINPEKVIMLRSAATVVDAPGDLPRAIARDLANPMRLSSARQRVAREMFYEPGSATDRAVALLHELIDPARSPRLTERAHASA